MSNFDIAKTFGDQFDPPIAPVSVQRINNVPHRDAWMVATYDKDTGYGITAHAYAGQLHAFIETLSNEPETVGKLMARWLKEVK